MAITYKTVIASAIAHFNDIQTELYALGAKRADGSTAITATSGTLVPTDEFDTIIKGQLQLKATGTYTLTKNDATEDVSAYKYVKPRDAASFTLSITDKAGSDVTVGTVSSGYYPLTASLQGTLSATTAGWFSSGSATDSSVIVGRIKQGTFSNLTGVQNDDGDFVITSTITAGYYKSDMTLTKTYKMANATFTNGSATNATFTVTENSTDSNIASAASVSLTKASSGYYYAIDLTSTGSATVKSNAAGYVKAATNVGTGTVSGSDTAYVSITAAAGSVEVNSPTVSPGSISIVDVSSSTDSDGHDAVSGTLGDIYKSLSAATTTLPSSGYYVAVKSNSVTRSSVISADATIATAGYIPTSYNFGAASGNVTISAGDNYYIPVAAATLKNEATSNVTYITNSSVTLKDGYLYIDAGYIPNTKVSLSALIPDISNDALASHILSGYSAYNEAGELINGSITTWSAPSAYYTTTSSSGVSGSAVTASSYTGSSTQYIKKGSVTAPSTVSGTGSTVAVSSGTVTLTKTVSITPNVSTAGWVSSGTAGNSTVTLSGTIETTSMSASVAKSCTIANNTTSPTASAGKAVVSDSTSAPFNTYVTVSASSKGTASVGTGYISEGTIDFAASDTARIAAALNPNVTNGTPSATINLTNVATFDATTGEVTSQYATAQTATISAVKVLDASTSYKDKYIIGTFSAKTNAGTASVTVGEDVTGTSVDHYTEQLYKRMLGLNYEAVEADAA